MRISVECGGFTRAADACLTANQTSAVLTRSLAERLAGHAGMAGDDATSADFARAYDAGAEEALAALADLTHAFIGAGRLLDATGAEHAEAEAAAAFTVTTYSGRGLEDSFVRIQPPPPPSSLGAQEPSLSAVHTWILDQLEGFVWPGADVPGLRAAGSDWRRAAASTAGLADHVDAAITLVEQQRSPEVPLAVDVLTDLTTLIGDTAWQLSSLASACEEYAEAVEAARDRTRALLEEVAQMIVEGVAISAFVTAISGGLGGGASAVAVLAKIRAQAPRFYALLTALRAGVATAAARLDRALDDLAAIRLRVEKFLKIPARNEAGTMKPPGKEWLPRRQQVADTIADPSLFDPQSLRGMDPAEIKSILAEWKSSRSNAGDGVRFEDPTHKGRQIRLMDGYPGNRPDPMTHGPYAVVSQNGGRPIKVPLEGNPTL